MAEPSKMDRAMDAQLQQRFDALQAGNDETGDGKLDAADLKAQLNRIEAQLELQDAQNRKLLRGQQLRMVLTLVLAVLLAVAVGILWVRTNEAFAAIQATCAQVNALIQPLQTGLLMLDPEELNAMMEDLPAITEQLRSIDVDALNDALNRLPGIMDSVASLQQQVTAISNWFSQLGSVFGR